MSDGKELAPGQPSVIRYESFSGEIVHITPINLATLAAIDLMAKDKFPYPDPTPYKKPLENGLTGNEMIPASENPEYIELCRAVDQEREEWKQTAIFDYSVSFPMYPSKQALIDAYKERLERLRKVAKLPDDDYQAILLNIIFAWNKVSVSDGKLKPSLTEYSRVIQMAIQTYALEFSEVSAGIKFFRPIV